MRESSLCPILRGKSFVLSWLLVAISFLAFFVLPTSGLAYVTVYANSNCPAVGLKKTYAHAWPWDLSTQYYDGTSISLNNSISSIKIHDGWEVLACNSAGFVQCAAQLNTEKQVDSYDDDESPNPRDTWPTYAFYPSG